MNIKSPAVTLLGSALVAFSCLQADAQTTTVYTDADSGTANAGSWSDDGNWNAGSPNSIGSTAVVQIGTQPSAASGHDIFLDVGGAAQIASLTFNASLNTSGTGTVTIEADPTSTLQVNGNITNNSNLLQTVAVNTTFAGANATYAGGAGGLLIGELDLKQRTIATTGTVEVSGDLYSTISSTTTYGHIGAVTAIPGINIHISTGGTTYVGVAGDFFQVATGTFTNAHAVTSDAALPSGLQWLTTLVQKGIFVVEPTAAAGGTTIINSGITLPIDKDSEFNVAGTAIVFNGTSTNAAELLTDNAETATGTVTPVGTPFSTTRNITINSSSKSIIAAMNGTTATYGGVISDAGGTAGTLIIGDATNHGTVVLATNNSVYTGGTTVVAGTNLQIGNTTGSATGTGAVNLAAGNTITGITAGAKIGGQLNLIGNNTITTTAGSLTLGSLSVTNTGNVISTGSAVTGNTTLGAGAGFAVNGALTGTLTMTTGTLTGTGSVSGAASITGGTVNGNGLAFTTGATFNGTTGNVLSGTESGPINVAAASSLSQTTGGNSSGTLTLGTVGTGGSSFTAAGTSTVGAVTLNGGNDTLTGTTALTTGGITVNGLSNTIAGTVSGAIVQNANSTLVVTGNAGSDALNTGSTLSGTGTVTTVTLAGTDTLTSTGTLHTSGVTVAGAGNAISTGSTVAGNTTITGTGALAVNGALTGTLGVGTGTLTGTGSVSGAVTAAGGTINGTGLHLTSGATYSGAGNTLAGTETGSITEAGGAALTQSTTGTLTGALALGAGTTSFTAAGTSTVGAVTLNGGGNTLTGTTNLTTSGIAVNSLGNTIAGTVTGAITQNTGSSLAVNGTGGADSVGTGSTLSGTGTVGAVTLAGTDTLTSSGTLHTGGITISGNGNAISTGSTIAGNATITGTGSLDDEGALTGTLGVGTGTLTGAGSVGGATTVAGGTINGNGLVLTTGATFSGTTNNVLAGSESGPINVAAASSLSQTTGGNSSGTLTLGTVGTGGSSFTAAGTSTVGAVTLNGGNDTLTGTTALTTGGITVNGLSNTIAGTVSGAIVQNANSTLVVTGNAGSDALNTGSTLSGTGTVTTVTLAGTDTLTSTGTLHTSGVTVAGAGNAISTGSTVAGNTTITGTGALAVNGALTGTLGVGTGTLTGTGSVSGAVTAAGGTINGTGLHLTSGATYSGAGNTLAGTETGSITEAGGAALTQSTTGTLTGALALGAGTTSFTAAGTSTVGAVTLNGGGNTLTGTTNLTTSGIAVNSLGNTIAGTVTGAITQNTGSSLAVNGTGGADSVGTGSTLSGTGTVGAVTLAGTDTLTSSGTLHTGGITISGNGNAISTGSTIAGNATITGTGSLDDEGALTGTLGVGTGTLTGAGSVGGATTVAGGTINGNGLVLTTGATFSGTTNNVLAGSESGPINVAAASSLSQTTGGNSSGTLTLGTVGTGGSSFTAAGTSTVGAVTLNGGNDTLTGTTALTTGGITVNGLSNTIAGTVSGAIVQNANSTLVVTGNAGSDALNTGSTLSGTGTVTTVTLAGTDTLTSTGTLHTSGVTVAGAGNAISTGSTVAGNTTITGTGALAVNGALTGTLGVGTGTLTGTGSVSGAVTAAGGTINGTGLHLTSGATYSGAGNTLAGTETGSITEAGGAALTQSTTGTLTGALALGAGTTSFTAAGTSTVGAVTLNGGGNTLTGTTNLTTSGIAVNSLGNTIAGTVTGAITQNTGSSLAVNGTGGADSVGTGSTLSGTGTVGAVTLAGTDTLTSSGTLHTGGITVNGTNNTFGAGTIAGNTTLGAGAALAVTGNLTGTIGVGNGTLTGTGTISGAATVGNGGKIDTSAGLGTLTIGGLTTSSGSALNFAISTTAGVTNTSRIASTGSLSIGTNTTVNLSQIAGTTLVDGFYTLLTYSGAAPTQGNLVLASTSVDGQTLSLDYQTAGQVRLDVAAPVSTTTYTLGSSATATRVLTNGTTTVTSTITNTGSADTLDYTGLNATTSGGTLTGITLPKSGTALAANGGTSSGTATFNAPGTAGAVTITPTVTTAINTTMQTPSTLTTTAPTTVNVVNQRTFTTSGTGTVALGRFLTTTAPTGSTAVTSTGLHAVTGDASLASFGATGTNGLALTTTDPTTFNGTVATQAANYVLSGTATAGTINGTFTSNVTAELGSIAPVVVTVTGDAVNQRTFTTSGTGTLALGRFLTTATPTASTTVSSTGLNNVTANATVNGFTGTGTNGLNLTTTDSNVFNGGTATQNAVYNLGGTATAGIINGTFNSTVTAELGTIAPITVAVTGDAVNQRTFTTSGTGTIALGRFLVTAPSSGSTTVTSAGLNNVTANGTVNGFTGTGTNGLTLGLTAGSNVFNGATASQSATYSVGGTATTGTINGSFSSTVTAELGTIAPITVAVTGDAVNQRTFTVSGTGTIALGRFLTGAAQTGSTSITSLGLNNVTANATLGNFSGAGTGNLTLTTGDSTVFNGAAATQTANYTLGGTTSTAGAVNGTFTSNVTAELGSIAPVTVAVTGDAVNQRTFTQSTGTINLGRFILANTPTTGTDVISSTGLNAVTANATLGAFTGTNTNGLTLGLSSGSNVFNGAVSPQSATYTVGGTAGSAGAITGSFTSAVTAELGSINPVTVNVTADAVNKRTIANGATTDFGVLHSGGAVSATSSAFTTTGLNATTTSVTVAAGSGTADVNGVKATGAANSFDGSTLNQSGTRTLSGTVSSVGGGTVAGTINLGVTTLENGGAGLAGEGAYSSVALNYTAFVYTGQGVWKTNGGGTWGVVSATPANWTANGGTPGLDANFTTTDSATFGNVLVGTGTVTLSGDNPSLNAVTFNDTAGSYTIAQGSGGTLKMNAGTGTAAIADANGSHAISAPIELDSNTSVDVVNGGDVLTISGIISGGTTKNLTLGTGGAGKVILSGANTFTGATTIGSGTVQFQSPNALTSSSTVTQTGGTIDVDGNAQTLNNFSSTGGTITNTGGGAPTTITFDIPADPVNASNITGNIAVNKTGAGLLAFTGNNTYTGGTTINGGTLDAGSTTAFGMGNVTNVSGTLGAYGAEHMINVNGNFQQDAGGTLFINLNTNAQTSPNNDLLNVTGTAIVNGGIDVHFGFLPVKGNLFDIITATGGITPTDPASPNFPTAIVVNQPGIHVAGELTQTNHTFTLDVTQAQLQLAQALGSYATPNRTAILTALSDPSLATNDPTLFNILATLVTSQSATAVSASVADTADQFNPAKFGNFVQTTIVNTAVFNTAELDSYWESQRSAHGDFLTSNAKLDSSGLTVLNPSMDPALAQVGSRLLAWSPASLGHGMLSDSSSPELGGVDMKASQPNESLSNDPFSTFVVGNVILAQGFSQSDVAHSDTTTGGVQLGADYRLTPHLRAGALFSFNHTDGTLDTNLSKATIDSYAPGAYISYADSGWYVNGVASYGFNNYTEDRHLSLLGASAVAHGAASGEQITANMDGGYDFHLNKFTFGPLAGLQYTHLSVDSYNEDGASNLGANLAVGDQSGDSLRSRVGGHVSYLFQTGRVLLTPHLDVSWQHEFMDQAEGITAGVGGVPFTVTTARPSRDSALIDGGVNADLNGTVSVFGDYLIQAGQSNYFGQSIQAGVKIGF